MGFVAFFCVLIEFLKDSCGDFGVLFWEATVTFALCFVWFCFFFFPFFFSFYDMGSSIYRVPLLSGMHD